MEHEDIDRRDPISYLETRHRLEMRIWNREYWILLSFQFKALTKDLKSKLEGVVAGRAVPSAEFIPIGSARKMNAAVLFFDIKGSSNRSGLPALYMLDIVIPMVMRIVHDYEGYVEKNTGDGVMAIFTGTDEKKASTAALETAMTCFYVLKNLINPHLVGLNIPVVDARIGIDFGELLVARIGTPKGSAKQERSFLTAIGPTANIACHLQEQAGTNQIWVGNDVKLRAPEVWQTFFDQVFPSEWTWVISGTSYPAWHFNAVRSEIQLPTPAPTILTPPPSFSLASLLGSTPSPPTTVPPLASLLESLLRKKGPS